MLNAIAKPFGILLLWIYSLVGNYGVAIILFACVVKVILLPFQMKSKKGMMRMNRLAPRMKDLEKRYEGNQKKYQEEVSKMYKEEHCSPMSGCLWSLIPFPILLALYQAIRYPLTVMMRVPSDLLAEGGSILNKLNELGFTSSLSKGYLELDQSQFISSHFADFAGLSDKLVQINYKFLGLNLGTMPQWNFFAKCDWSQVSSWLPALGLFLIPVISALLSWLSMVVSQAATAQPDTQQAAQMKSMNIMMPLVSLYICFIMPAALGIYWIFNSLLAIIQDLILNKYYGKIMDKEDAARLERDRLREAELERKRQETERLKAEGGTERNGNTSKKKIQAKQKAELDALKAAAQREERAKRRERLGVTEEEKPDSQVGSRRYARGRAYVADRYTNPENAAAETAAAAAESEFGASIDDTAEDDTAPIDTAAAETAEETSGENTEETSEETAEETAGDDSGETADSGEETTDDNDSEDEQ